MPLINISGQRFGSLLAIRPIPASKTQDHRPGWLVHCDCGNDKVVNGSALRSGKITSCGCGLTRGKRVSGTLSALNLHEDITGQRFGHLTAVEYLGNRIWRWRCDCGKMVDVRTSAVKSGKTKSCGHVLRDTAREKISANILQHHDGSSVSTIRPIVAGKLRKTNTTGVTGVSIRPRKGYVMYRAQICVRGKTIFVGEYKTLEQAAAARKRAEEQYFAPIIEDFEKRRT